MNDDVLLDQNLLFETYFQEALIIRAICDDLEFPGEYSPVFVNIHIRGEEHFRKSEDEEKMLRKVFEFISPEVPEKLTERIEAMEDEEARRIVSQIHVGPELNRMDRQLEELEEVKNFFSKQIANLKRLYFEEDYRNHMITLYNYFVKPFMSSYDDQKIQQAFHKGRIRDMIRRVKEKKDRKFGEDKNSA